MTGTDSLQAMLDSGLSSANVSDVLDRFNVYGALNHQLVGLNHTRRFIGEAYTVRWVQNRKGSDIHQRQPSSWEQVSKFLVPELSNGEGRGKVYVAGAGPLLSELALAGGLSSTYVATNLNFNAMVLGGAVRDSDVVNELSMPVVGSNFIPVDTQGSYAVAETGTSCVIDQVEVHTGDIVLGDHDGLVVIPKAIARDVLAQALELVAAERSLMEKIKAGINLPELIGDGASI